MRPVEKTRAAVKPSVQLGCIRFEVTDEMRTALGFRSGRRRGLAFLFAVSALLLGGLLRPALAQVPLPMQEQIQMFNSLPAAQQQALIREMQRQLPPAERDAILSALQGQAGGQGQQQPEINSNALAALDGALRAIASRYGFPTADMVAMQLEYRWRPGD